MTAAVAGLVREGLVLALWLAAPLLVAALLAGVVTGLLGAFTQVQDPAVSLAVRVAAVGIAVAAFAPAIAHQVTAFTARLWPMIAAIGAAGGGA